MWSKKGQATVEYLLLMVVIAAIFFKVIVHVQDIFYGWDGQQGAIELFIQNQVVDKLSTSGWH
jgi:hypothetical protein